MQTIQHTRPQCEPHNDSVEALIRRIQNCEYVNACHRAAIVTNEQRIAEALTRLDEMHRDGGEVLAA